MDGPGAQRFQTVPECLTFAFRLFIGGLFVYASLYKILEPGTFAESVRNYMILPPAWSNLVALTLPWVEMGAGIFLILGIQTRPSALIATGMLGAFLGAVVYAYSIGLDIDCGCFTSGQNSAGRIGIYHIARDTALFLISLFVVFFDRGAFNLSRLTWSRGLLRYSRESG